MAPPEAAAPEREYEKVLYWIRSRIADGSLKTGDRLPTERDLAARLQIGRNSTREALRTLENMGVTVSRQGSGHYLAGDMARNFHRMIEMMLLMQAITPAEIRDFRSRLDLTVCEMILANPEAPRELDALIPIWTKFAGAAPDQQVELDREFHYRLIQATGNRMLIFLMGTVIDVYRQWIDRIVRGLDHVEQAELHRIHGEILHGLQARNREDVHRAIAAHYAFIDQRLRT